MLISFEANPILTTEWEKVGKLEAPLQAIVGIWWKFG